MVALIKQRNLKAYILFYSPSQTRCEEIKMLVNPQSRKHVLLSKTTQPVSSNEEFFISLRSSMTLHCCKAGQKNPISSVPENKYIKLDKNFHIFEKTYFQVRRACNSAWKQPNWTILSIFLQFVLFPACFHNAGMALTVNYHFCGTLSLAVIYLRVQAIFKQISWRVLWSLSWISRHSSWGEAEKELIFSDYRKEGSGGSSWHM